MSRWILLLFNFMKNNVFYFLCFYLCDACPAKSAWIKKKLKFVQNPKKILRKQRAEQISA